MFPLRLFVFVAVSLTAASLVEAAQPAGQMQRHARMVSMKPRGKESHNNIEDAVPDWRKYVTRMQKEGKEPVSLVRFASKRSEGWSPFDLGDDNNNGNDDGDDGDHGSSSSSSSPSKSSSKSVSSSTSSSKSSGSSSSSPSGSGSSDGDDGGDKHTGQGTYYTPGLGSCGKSHSSSDMIVAVSHEMYDSKAKGGDPNSNPLCGKEIEAQYGSRKVHVKVVDRCTGCKGHDLDFSPAAFKKLSSMGKGRLHNLKWKFVD